MPDANGRVKPVAIPALPWKVVPGSSTLVLKPERKREKRPRARRS